MKSSTLISEEQLITRAVEALIDRLGAVEASRFLSLASSDRCESVRRHRLWQGQLDKDQFFDQVFGEA